MQSIPLLLFILSHQVQGLSTSLGGQDFQQCCIKALEEEAFLDKSQPASSYICGQAYSSDIPPALELNVDYKWCKSACGGWQISSDPSQWAVPLVGFILPAVIFAMTIPRRQKLEVPDSIFKFRIGKIKDWPRIGWSLIIATPIATFDMVAWVSIIFVFAGPMIMSGLHEALIDYRVINHLDEHGLNPREKAKILVAVLAGNLDVTIGDPEELSSDVYESSIVNDRLSCSIDEKTQPRLIALMASQMSFGATIGAPVLFYLGAFIYSLIDIDGMLGNNDTAHSLAFGMWWMSMVSVAVVSGCLAASNNPCTLGAIIGRPESGNKQKFLPFCGPAFESRFQPVAMWSRGNNKRAWIRRTEWHTKGHSKISLFDWVFKLLGPTLLLVTIPGALAFMVSYTTPTISISCRSMTYLMYTLCEYILVFFAAWYNNMESFEVAKLPRHLYILFYGMMFVTVPIALLTGIGGTLMQIIGIYRNCSCMVSILNWTKEGGSIGLASDTQLDRTMAQKWWKGAGFGAIGFMCLQCYVGWWYQRYTRREFRVQVERLSEDPANELVSSQPSSLRK
jgi:hypothetical protein